MKTYSTPYKVYIVTPNYYGEDAKISLENGIDLNNYEVFDSGVLVDGYEVELYEVLNSFLEEYPFVEYWSYYEGEDIGGMIEIEGEYYILDDFEGRWKTLEVENGNKNG